jgi:hypothetical protein
MQDTHVHGLSFWHLACSLASAVLSSVIRNTLCLKVWSKHDMASTIDMPFIKDPKVI